MPKITPAGKKHEQTIPAPRLKKALSGPPKVTCCKCGELVLKAQTHKISDGRACRSHPGVIEESILLRVAKKYGFVKLPTHKCWTCGVDNPSTFLDAPTDDDFRHRKVLRSFQPIVNATDTVFCCAGCIKNLCLEVPNVAND